MMSAERFARQGAVWHRSTPTIEQYIRWVNEKPRKYGALIISTHGGDLNSLLAEIAFRSLYMDPESAEESARKYIALLPRGAGIAASELSQQNRRDIAVLRSNVQAYVRQSEMIHDGADVRFEPAFAGCGLVEPAFGDVLVGPELIEIKAVQRQFRSSDLRQLLTYCALGYATGSYFAELALVNPRLGTYFNVGVDDLAPDLGAGSWPELMKDLIDAMSGLDVSL